LKKLNESNIDFNPNKFFKPEDSKNESLNLITLVITGTIDAASV
jgi:hypothetical protein